MPMAYRYNITIPQKANAWGALHQDEFGVNLSYSECVALGVYLGWSKVEAQIFAEAYSDLYPVDASERSLEDQDRAERLIRSWESRCYLKSGSRGTLR